MKCFSFLLHLDDESILLELPYEVSAETSEYGLPLRDAHFEEAVSVGYRKIFLVYLYPHIFSHDQLT